MTLAANEFIRRFLLHTLPDGFHRIRHYGFLANGHRAKKLELCRGLLATPAPGPADKVTPSRRHDHCLACGSTSIVRTILPRLQPGRSPFWYDTS